MNEGWMNAGADYVVVRVGLDELIGLAVERYDARVRVRMIPDDGDTYTATWVVTDTRRATPLEIYEHAEARLRRQQLGPDYGLNASRTMWDLMTDRDRDYWRSLRPEGGPMTKTNGARPASTLDGGQ
jgi:hypothetical protein